MAQKSLTARSDKDRLVESDGDLQALAIGASRNVAPILQPLPDGLEAHPTSPFSFTALANDPNGDTVTYSLTSPPAGMTINSLSGVVSWTPTWSQLGPATVTVRATDPGGLSDSRSTTVTVVNHAPILNTIPDQDAHPTTPLSFTALAMDPDGDVVTYSLINPPSGATINSATGVVNWTPSWSQLGAKTITVRATDPGGLYDTRSCTITVANQPPILNPLDDADAHPGIAITFTALAMDPDGDVVTYSLVSPPPGATINSATGVFNWTPTWSQLGAWTVTVRATDPGGLTDNRSCTITVGNQAPTLNALADQNAQVGTPLVFTAFASDPDGDPLTYSLINPPAGATINNAGAFNWTPTSGQVGATTITVRVADPGGLADVRSCTVTVTT